LANLLARVRTVFARTKYDAPRNYALTLDSPQVESIRQLQGGALAPLPVSKSRWYIADLETAQRSAEYGALQLASRLWDACHTDGIFLGVLSTLTQGLVRLPKVFDGPIEMVERLASVSHSVRSEFDEMFPPSELAAFVDDIKGLGVAVAELIPIPDRGFPLFVRLDPQYLTFRLAENRWYYASVAGLIPVTPGDGRWVLHTEGRVAPWTRGLWRACGKAWIYKEHAQLYDSNWQSKLANPARVATAPQGGTEAQKQSWFKAVMAWGINSVFGVTPGYDVKLLESNGRGSESFERTIERAEREYKIAIAGQDVTTDGGTGFQNSDIHSAIRSDLIKATADGLAYTLNTQALPVWTVMQYGPDAVETGPVVRWDVTPPSDKVQQASAMRETGLAIRFIDEALAPHGLRSDVKHILDSLDIRYASGAVETKESNANMAT
jgi:hypothetical protein